MGFERMAEDMGVRVVLGRPPHGWWGCYDPDLHQITLLKGLGHVQLRSTAWHELGHAHYRHVGCTPSQERQASYWAARHLINPRALISAAQISDDIISIAHRLNVMPDDVRHFERSLTVDDLILLRKEIDGTHH
jgi:hypothetical protein